MPLRYLFVDMNAFFASCEQQERPELRGQPVAVVPTRAETTCCIAASYEAKPFGVRTGTLVFEARRRCPDIRIVEARPHLYVRYHRWVVEAIEACLPVGAICSIDEMACPLEGEQQRPERAVALAREIKERIVRDVGDTLRCSVGIAPNVLLAKLASDLQKPDGLTVIAPEDLPGRLYALALDDFPGIGPRMLRRLREAGVATTEQLCGLSRPRLKAIWGSQVMADRWFRRLRGEDVPDPPTRRRSVGHGRVLPPACRNDPAARAILVCLLHKAAARLRQMGHWCGSLSVSVRHWRGESWHAESRFGPTRDTLTLTQQFNALWPRKPPGRPLQVQVVLGRLADGRDVAPPLFEEERGLQRLADAMDRINHRFGKHAVHFGGMLGAAGEDHLRIAFTRIPDY